MRLRFNGVAYDRTLPLISGEVQPEGIELDYVVDLPNPIFRRMFATDEFDASELSSSNFIIERARGDRRFVALPIFPSRCFRHNGIYVNVNAGIERPEDLRGKRMGIPEYFQTANFWIRAFLQHDYGVEPSSIQWRYGGVETPYWAERLEHPTPPGIDLQRIPADRSLVQMLEAGELDALALTHSPKLFVDASPKIRRLFPDYRPVEEDYFRRTGFFPIMHTVVIRRDVYEANRWVATSLLRAFQEAKEVGRRRMRNMDVLAVSDPWWETELEAVDSVFGGDAFPYGFAANASILEAMTQFSSEQGLSQRKLDPAELFAPETLDL